MRNVIQMKSLMGVLFVTALLVLFGLATPKPIDINEECGPFVGSRKIKFTKSQKKWSKLEPSISREGVQRASHISRRCCPV
ncbi:hypothetical protein NECAME_13997 [Necator americanus]|uniref:Transthyretin-like family protein n=1 Tax=Necator americanus TaxID=51031 RepID=W2SQN5_NECAM|nr:hypothetical protein NECAME_13997 [Necator americanus]ETN72049.1 hypothetical protein NECAME_13997 [Necator americanus]